MFIFNLKSFALMSLAAFIGVQAETHTIHFDNRCGHGTPTLIQGKNVLSIDGAGNHVANGPIISAIAYLQTGVCGFNGENCLIVETTLVNPTTPGSGSSTDLSLVPPHAFQITTGFGYYGGCDGAGADCTGPNCSTAFMNSGQTDRQVACQVNNVNLAITFCD